MNSFETFKQLHQNQTPLLLGNQINPYQVKINSKNL